MKDPLGVLLMRWRIRKVLPYASGRLLDIGCGTNALVRSYPGQGLGVDVRQWGDVDLVVDDSSKLPLEDGTVDTVMIIAALNHIPNREDVLGEAHRLLSCSGRIVITMIPPRLSTVWHFLRRRWDADQVERGMEEGEVYGLTRKEIRWLLETAGFRVITEKPFMFGVNCLIVAERV